MTEGVAQEVDQDGTPPSPGWYADPDDPGRRRWWTGSEWGPRQTRKSPTTTTVLGAPLLPVAVFAAGFALLVAAAFVLLTPFQTGATECGSALAPGIGGLDVSPTFAAFARVACAEARSGRIVVGTVVAILGVLLLAASFLLRNRMDREA